MLAYEIFEYFCVLQKLCSDDADELTVMVTFFTLYVAQRLHFFEPKPVDIQTVISFGLFNGISLASSTSASD
jgi:hypothetical protein